MSDLLSPSEQGPSTGRLSSSLFSRVFGGALSLGFAQVSLIVFGLITVVIAVRYVDPDEYGAFVILQVLLTFLTEFTNFGLSLAIPQKLASSSDRLHTRRVINTAIWFRVLTAVSAGALILLFRFALVNYMGLSVWSNLLLYLPALLGLSCLESTFVSILQGLFKFKLIAAISILGILINLIFTLVLVMYLHLGMLGLIYAKLIPIAFQILVAGLFSKIEYRLELHRQTLRQMLAFGFPLQIQYVLDFVYTRIDTIIIASLLGTVGAAYYEVARKIPDSVMQLLNAYRSAYFPIIAELDARSQDKKASEMMNTSVRGLSFIALLGTMISVTFGKDIILLLFSSRYLTIYPLFVLLMIARSLNIVENTLGFSLTAIGEPDKPLYVNIARGIAGAAGNLLVIPILGSIGAPLVSLFSNLVAVPMDMLFLARRKYLVRSEGYIKPLVLLGGSSAAFYVLGSSSYVIKLGMTALFLAGCIVFSVITKADILVIMEETKAMVVRITGRHRMEHAGL